ncbi:hypothetical protein J9317_03890 [Metabacillus sp. KIGAM252]|uniref:Immunity protein 30 domain-containing protein n=1 Tax=Metabacillus flavus TaxID=2823519 RepID=A0ABS5LB05_9BACI|nr:Imm47 family immunity protein [Metabacillus flavus]MBS2967916.1 hypothetical protein [Metabacillus flavus]
MKREIDVLNSIWYGEQSTSRDINSLKNTLPQITNEIECMIIIAELLKLGDFESKQLLIDLLNTAKDEEVLNFCIKLFCSVSSHKDLLNSENLLFLSNVSEKNADTFASSAVYTLSYHVIPYLLALLEEWEDTSVEETIRNSLDIMLDYTDEIGEDATVEEIGELYYNTIKSINRDKYYYYLKPVFPGDLARNLVEKSIISLRSESPLNTHVIPSLLSIWSGLRCPVYYSLVINDAKYKELINYVKTLSNLEWETGEKYFYGNKIN